MSLLRSKRLIVTVEPQPGEALLSIVARAASANGFELISHVLRLAGISSGEWRFSPFTLNQTDAAPLAALLSLPVEAITSRLHNSLPSVLMPEAVNWFGTTLPRRYVEAIRGRYSPSTLENFSNYRAAWMVRPLQFCPESMEILIHHCGSCGCKLNFSNADLLQCCSQCRAPFRAGRVEKVTDEFLSDAKAIASLVSHDAQVRNQSAALLPKPFNEWEPGEAFAAAVELGAVTCESRTSGGNEFMRKIAAGNFSSFTTAHLVKGYRFVKNWPTSLRELMQDAWGGRQTRELRQLAGPLAKFYDRETRPTRLRNLMQKEIPTQLRAMNIPIRSTSGVRPAWLDGKELISQTVAATTFQIDKSTLRRLIKEGECVHATEGGRLYDRDVLAVSIKVLRESVRAVECAEKIGVPVYCLGALVHRGLLQPIEDRDARLLAGEQTYQPQSVGHLIKQLTELSPSDDTCNRRVTDVMRHRFHPDDWADLVSALIDGRLRVVHKETRQSSAIASLFFEPGDAAKFLANLPNRSVPNDVTLSCTAAAELLNMTDVFVSRAIATGVIRGRSNPSGAKLNLANLAEFDRRYVTSRELSQTLNVEQRHVSAHMRIAGVAPVFIVHKVAIWQRSDVEEEPAKLPGGAESPLAELALFGVAASEIGVAGVFSPR
jgi:hypothetical protein